jgi:hypothetical protein
MCGLSFWWFGSGRILIPFYAAFRPCFGGLSPSPHVYPANQFARREGKNPERETVCFCRSAFSAFSVRMFSGNSAV